MGRKVKVLNLQVNTYGNYLGINHGCITLRDKEKNVQSYPLSEAEVGEVVLNCGNTVSVDALAMLSLWGIDVLIATHNGRTISMLKNLADDSHVKTRIAQYESLINGKSIAIAKQIILAKLHSQNLLLKKYKLKFGSTNQPWKIGFSSLNFNLVAVQAMSQKVRFRRLHVLK